MAGQQTARTPGASSQLMVNLFDGSRQLMPPGKSSLITLTDGTGRRYRVERPGPSLDLQGIAFYDNNADNYAVVAYVDGYRQAGYQPIALKPEIHPMLDLMLVARGASYNFSGAKWADVELKRPLLARLLGENIYWNLTERQPASLACLLNIATASEQIVLEGIPAMAHLHGILTEELAPDRFYAWSSPRLVRELAAAAASGLFHKQPSADLLLHSGEKHGPATSSFKQLEFSEANVQFTFHEGTRQFIGSEDCVLAEIDIDYYVDPANHAALEVIPNNLIGSKTNPEMVYVLRWIAARRQSKDFDPLYTIV